MTATYDTSTDTAASSEPYNYDALAVDLYYLCHILDVVDAIVGDLKRTGDASHDDAVAQITSLVWLTVKHAREVDRKVAANYASLGGDQ